MKRSIVTSLHSRRPRRWRARRGAYISVALFMIALLGLRLGVENADASRRGEPISVLRGGGAWNGTSSPQGRRPDGAALSGRVTHVRDGDTIEVLGTPVRIANLDCAERGTPTGRKATARMRDLARRGPMHCRLEGRKSYDREVGVCSLSDGRDIGEVLIAERLCERWRW